MNPKILIVGSGSMGQRHSKIVRESLPNADVRVLAHFRMGPVEGANGYFSDIHDAIAFKPEIAVIANASPKHVETAIKLASAGCHLLIEKPLSNTCKSARQLLKMVAKSSLVMHVGYNLRFDRSLNEFRKQIRSGCVGRIYSVRIEAGQNLVNWRPGKDYRNGVSANKSLGGGVLLELSHEIDYMRWIFGEPSWVTAWLGHLSSLEVDVEDTANLLFEIEGNKRLNGSQNLVVSMALDFVRHDQTRRCFAIGDCGTLVWDGVLGTVTLHSDERAVTLLSSHQTEQDATYREQWRHFTECIVKKVKPKATVEDGLAVLEIIDGVRRSSKNSAARTGIVYK